MAEELRAMLEPMVVWGVLRHRQGVKIYYACSENSVR